MSDHELARALAATRARLQQTLDTLRSSRGIGPEHLRDAAVRRAITLIMQTLHALPGDETLPDYPAQPAASGPAAGFSFEDFVADEALPAAAEPVHEAEADRDEAALAGDENFPDYGRPEDA